MSQPTPGPCETLARLALQSNRYRDDADFRDAVDSVLGHKVYDAALAMREALEAFVTDAETTAAYLTDAAYRRRVKAARALLAALDGASHATR